MPEGTFRVTTLGCRVNRADSLAIERDLAARGYVRAGEDDVPDIWVVNTCAVTSEGMKKSRKAVRRCAGSGARVIVTGCGADLDPSAFACKGVEAVRSNSDKDSLVHEACGGPDRQAAAADWSPRDLVRVPVKVQDGCTRFCSYCIVPHLRPAAFSRPLEAVVAEAEEMVGLGAGEIILCGIDLGSYADTATGARIDRLAAAVRGVAGDAWMRLSSIELSDVSEPLLDLMNRSDVSRHLHLPLQSGDAGVLESMGREYTPEQFRSRVAQVRRAVPEVAITSDVMVGFPGEDEAAFAGTLELVEQMGFSRLHVFKYSRRPLTRAFELGDPVSPQVKSARAKALRDAAQRAAAVFHASMVGRIIPVLVESSMNSEPGMLFGRAESFAGAVFEGEADLIGSVKSLKVTSSDSSVMRGLLVRTAGEDELIGR